MRHLIRTMLVLAALLTASVGWAAEDLARSQLADEARRWQDKGRDDLAADAWRRLLVSQPRDGEALVNLGLIELRAGNPAQARRLYERASQLKKPPARLKRLRTALEKVDLPAEQAPAAVAAAHTSGDQIHAGARPEGVVSPRARIEVE